ncbi:hypothetical protein M440DRAFT_1396085 [Trichoderma longibrachiatum ATCC 18648]|uniref:Uncharacterized protein n=1 Tax=Trichoderma longibrachiatum ATCC 18648 TaxID=983965 RepID=A0A2T4CHB3_TRILO|nr:hypothetical protein M440DRAFT_1396085 [Trichoderma longibrachiatum ATCC 18648]
MGSPWLAQSRIPPVLSPPLLLHTLLLHPQHCPIVMFATRYIMQFPLQQPSKAAQSPSSSNNSSKWLEIVDPTPPGGCD